MPLPLLEVAGLCKSHDSRSSTFRVGATLDIRSGQAVGITGPSGCGKSTILEMLALLTQPGSVSRMFLHLPDASHDLADLWLHAPERLAAIRRTHLGFIHQGGGLYPFLSVRENILLPFRLNGASLADGNAAQRVATLLDMLGLTKVADNMPETLSYGERQRTAVARALAHNPKLVLADEPTSALDPETARNTMQLLLQAARECHAALIVVSHDHALLREVGIPALTMQCCASTTGETHYELETATAAPDSAGSPAETPAVSAPALPQKDMATLGYLAWRDFWHERALSLCAVLAFAAALLPLMVLGGLRAGVIDTLSQRLLNNPAALAVNPYSSRSYTEQDIAALGHLPNVAFIVPTTRTLASTVAIGSEGHAPVNADVIPTATGDPLLERYGCALPPQGMQANRSEPVVITQELARTLGVARPGAVLPLTIARRIEGRPESVSFMATVAAILPDAADWKAHVYMPLALLLDMERYRDGLAVPHRQWPGEEDSGQTRNYAGFRMYVDSLDAVIPIRDTLKQQGIDAYTFAREVETIQDLRQALTLTTLLVGGVTLLGMAFSLASLATANVRRKAMFYAQGHLMGLLRGELLALPLLQMTFVAVLAASASLLFYGFASIVLDVAAAPWLGAGESACRLPLPAIGMLYVGAFVLSSLCGLVACRHLLTFKPAEVLRRDA